MDLQLYRQYTASGCNALVVRNGFRRTSIIKVGVFFKLAAPTLQKIVIQSMLAIRHRQELSAKLGMGENDGVGLNLPESADDAIVAFRHARCKLVPVGIDRLAYAPQHPTRRGMTPFSGRSEMYRI